MLLIWGKFNSSLSRFKKGKFSFHQWYQFNYDPLNMWWVEFKSLEYVVGLSLAPIYKMGCISIPLVT